MKNRACFLDRDGVVNIEKDYLHDPAEVELETGIVAALRLLKAEGFLAIVVTNQAGVARGLYPEEDIPKVHARIQELLRAEGVGIDDFFYCPHHVDFSGACDCRKPFPGMLLAAARKHRIDLSNSMMVGDRVSDLEAGIAAGCRCSYLVRTGYGASLSLPDVPGVARADDALDAVGQFLRGGQGA